MNEDYRNVLEWTVWANLEKHNNVELILLKGHLILEVFVDNLLLNNTQGKYRKYSFYKKIKEIEKHFSGSSVDVEMVSKYLLSLNKIRNELAHEWQFNMKDGAIDTWAAEVLIQLPGTKHTKYTRRTKIVHAFSALAKAIVELE